MDRQPAAEAWRWTTKAWLVVSVLLVAVVAVRLQLPLGLAPTPLPVMGSVPAFSLTDQNGQSFASQHLEGRPWLASFIYTTCPGPCPLIIQRMAEVDRRLSRDGAFTIVSFSVDPDADTPEVLSVYADNHRVEAPHWRLLTGDTDELYALIRRGFLLGVERSHDADNAEGTVGDAGAVMHSTRLVLIDARMQVRGYYDSEDAAAMGKLVEDTTRLIDRSKP